MKKGFIFTIDAIYAVIFVVALAAGFAFYYDAAPTGSQFLENLDQQTTDTALVAFYLGKTAADYSDFKNFLPLDANHAKCAAFYTYALSTTSPPPPPLPAPTQGTITKIQLCRGIG